MEHVNRSCACSAPLPLVARVDGEPHAQLGDVFHDAAHEGLDRLVLALRHLEHELVVHGQEHPRFGGGLVSARSSSIIASLKMSAALPCTGAFCAMRIPHLADAEVVRRQLADLTAAPEDGRR